MTRLRIAPEAEQELAEAAAWYEERRAGLGVELIAVIDRVLEAILEMPDARGPILLAAENDGKFFSFRERHNANSTRVALALRRSMIAVIVAGRWISGRIRPRP